MYLFRIAFRNLFRRTRRTILIGSMLAAAVVVFLALDSFMLGMMEVSFRNVIDFKTPHVELGRREFFDKKDDPAEDLPIEEAFLLTEELKEDIKKIDGFRAMTKVTDFTANFVGPREDYPVTVRAIDPGSFDGVFRNRKYLVEGEFIESGHPGMIIGARLAELFELQVGDHATLLFRDMRDSFSTIEGEIKGIAATPHPDMNQHFVLIDSDNAYPFLGFDENKASQVMIRLKDREQAPEAVSRLNRLVEDKGYGQYMARSYRDASQMLVSLETWGYIETYFILGMILLVGAIGIINVVVLSALERTEEIGMMKAMGLKQSEIVRVFFYEAGGIGAIGAAIGCGAAALLIWAFSAHGIELAAIYGGVELAMGIPVIGNVYGVWNPAAFIIIFVFVVILSMLSSLPPSRWAAKKDPVKAIYHR